MTNYILALGLGLSFGFLLNKAGLTRYEKIVNVFVSRFFGRSLFCGSFLRGCLSSLETPRYTGGTPPRRWY